jgi:hypothetical protein
MHGAAAAKKQKPKHHIPNACTPPVVLQHATSRGGYFVVIIPFTFILRSLSQDLQFLHAD